MVTWNSTHEVTEVVADDDMGHLRLLQQMSNFQ